MEERVPEIRFKGFEEPWEKHGFSEITYPSGVKNRGNLPLESFSITNDCGFVPQDEKFENGGTMREADKRMYYIVSPKSFAYNPARINVGSIGYQNLSKDVIVSSLYEIFKTTDDVDDSFLWYWFKSDDFNKLIEQLQEGGVRLYFYYDKLCQGQIALPSVKEQQIIGNYLKNLDNLISLQQQKLDQLKTLKKACLEKMFPKNGSIVPEIRFAGFADAWEQRKLGDVARILGGNAWKASDYSDDGEYLVVTIANVSGEVIINDSVGNRISCDNPDVYLLNKGDILVSLTGNVGRVSKMSNIKGLLNQRVGKILPNNSDINADFLFHVLRNPHFERAMIDAGQGAAQKNIRNDDVLNYAFFLPVEKDEQNIIAHYFNRLDNLITLHQRKLDKLKSLKQACLEKMFV